MWKYHREGDLSELVFKLGTKEVNRMFMDKSGGAFFKWARRKMWGG